MLKLVFRKILSNGWKSLSLLLGSILVVGMVTAIPIYVDGILQRMLTKDLEEAQAAGYRYPGYVVLNGKYSYIGFEASQRIIPLLRQQMDSVEQSVGFEPVIRLEFLRIDNAYSPQQVGDRIERNFYQIGSMSGYRDHVQLLQGRFPSPQIENNTVEVIASIPALEKAKLIFGNEYALGSFALPLEEETGLKVRVVGVYERQDMRDLFWYPTADVFESTLLAEPALVESLHEQNIVFCVSQQMQIAAFDYHRFNINQVASLHEMDRTQKRITGDFVRGSVEWRTYFMPIISTYMEREANLRLALQVLIVPVLLMLVFYIYMVSQMMVRSERANISILESRGASRNQVLRLFGLESVLLGLVAYIAGMGLGVQMVRIIGAANGFLEFVGRRALPLQVSLKAWLYGAAAVLLIILTTLIPAFNQARSSIVQQKRSRSRRQRAPLWQRLFLDVILLGVSGYAYYRLEEQLRVLRQQVTASQTITATPPDFLLFLASTIFVLGAGLLFLRIYPWILRLIYFLGRKIWNPVAYATFHQISRSDGQEQFLMLFLILALSIGLFDANAARTINRYAEDNVHSVIGADIVVNEEWTKYDADGYPMGDEMPGMPSPDAYLAMPRTVKYIEPSLARYEKLDGIADFTKVFRQMHVKIERTSKTGGNIQLLAIDPIQFARTAWFRSDLSAYHLNEYMNVLAQMPKGILLSRNVKKESDLEVNQSITYSFSNEASLEGVIVAFIDFWPGYQPFRITSDGKREEVNLLIANLEYIHSQTAMAPYEMWLRREAGTTDKQIYDSITANSIPVKTIRSATQEITAVKNDPQLQGTNGVLTLGFIVSMLISSVGFLIYWILSVRGRSLQFGIFRAMGLGKVSIAGMLFFEQLLVSGAAIVAGTVIGLVASRLYVPLFQIAYSVADQAVPFRVSFARTDMHRIFLILGGLLVFCLLLLLRIVLKMRIDQAVKLGED